MALALALGVNDLALDVDFIGKALNSEHQQTLQNAPTNETFTGECFLHCCIFCLCQACFSFKRVKYTSICIAHFTQSASNALRHGSHSFTCKLHHARLYSPAAEHHRPLVGTHFTIPRRVEG